MTSHDVRRMKTCLSCGGIGIYKPKDPAIDVDLVVAAPNGYIHPKCCEVSQLLDLQDSELQNVRLCDVSQRTMTAILRRKEANRR